MVYFNTEETTSSSTFELECFLKIREGRFQTLEQCFAREYQMTLQAITRQISNDFSEGVRARLVAKCSAPKWDPSSLEKVSEDMVDAYFSPLNAYDPELDLSLICVLPRLA